MSDEAAATTDVAVIEPEEVAYQRPPILPSADEFNFVMQMADALSRSQLVPSSARGKPADVAIILLAARDMGIPVTQALAKLHVIEGKLSLSAEMMVALALRDGHRIWCDELTMQSSTACAQRKGSEYVARFTFSMEDAERAQLTQKDNWKKYPKAMLWARAVSGVVRMELPDVTAGVTYTPEEIGDEERFSAHPATAADPEIREALAARIAALPDQRKAELRQAWNTWGLTPLSRLTVEEVKAAEELVAKAEAIDVGEPSGTPGSPPGDPRPPEPSEAESGADGQPELPPDANAPVDTPDPTLDPEEARKLGVQRMVADKVTDEMLTKPTGELTDAESAILQAALSGAFGDEIVARIDALRAPHPDAGEQHEADIAGPNVFNGDSGYCAGCGGPIWYDADHWVHADEADNLIAHSEPPFPAIGIVDVDALYAQHHPVLDPKIVELKIKTEVGKMSGPQVIAALEAAGLPVSGPPPGLKARLVEHRLDALASETAGR